MSVAGPARKGIADLSAEVVDIVLLGVGLAVFFVVVPQIIGAGNLVKSALQGV